MWEMRSAASFLGWFLVANPVRHPVAADIEVDVERGARAGVFCLVSLQEIDAEARPRHDVVDMNKLHRTGKGAGEEAGTQQAMPESPRPRRMRRINLVFWAGACVLSLLIWLGLIVAVGSLLD